MLQLHRQKTVRKNTEERRGTNDEHTAFLTIAPPTDATELTAHERILPAAPLCCGPSGVLVISISPAQH
jgi:hypothetical protein